MLTRDELRHTHMLSEEEQAVVKWQFGLYAHFYTALFDAIKRADDNNLFRLELGFPNEVGGFLKFNRQEGWWQGVEEKLRELDAELCSHSNPRDTYCAECDAEKVDTFIDEVKHGDRDEEGNVL